MTKESPITSAETLESAITTVGDGELKAVEYLPTHARYIDAIATEIEEKIGVSSRALMAIRDFAQLTPVVAFRMSRHPGLLFMVFPNREKRTLRYVIAAQDFELDDETLAYLQRDFSV